MPKVDLSKLYNPAVNKQQWFAHQVKERYVLYGGAKGGGKTAWGINEETVASRRDCWDIVWEEEGGGRAHP